MKQIPGKIFLADQRGRLETAQFQRFCTFSFGACAAAHKEPFGDLLAVNEETLAGGQAVALPAAQAAHVLVLPLTGAVLVGSTPARAVEVAVEEIYLLHVPAGSTVHFTNPYAANPIAFLHVWLAADEATAAHAGRPFAFDAAQLANQLLELVPEAPGTPHPFRAHLGQFAGRAEAVYILRRPGGHFFAFVLAGAFEVEGRLLHAHDGLALWDAAAVELEALSHDALVLVLEVGP